MEVGEHRAPGALGQLPAHRRPRRQGLKPVEYRRSGNLHPAAAVLVSGFNTADTLNVVR
jgi:hypothetical protein